MTLRGLFVCFFELFLVILAFGTEIREFFVVAICVAALVGFSLLSILLASLTLRVDSTIDKKAAIRGDKIKYSLFLYGVALLPVSVYLSLKTTESEFNHKSRKRHSFMMIPSFKLEHKFVFEVPAVHVGTWEIGIKRMRFEDVFGLFAFPLIRIGKRDFAVDLSVMPQIHTATQKGENLSSGGFGETGYKNAEDGDLLGESRIYKAGDSLKRINWKLSARTKTMYSRQYEKPQKPKVVILVDNALSTKTVSDVADIVCETAISLACYYLSHNNIVDVVSVRGKKVSESKVYPLSTHSDIHNMQYDFARFLFYKNETEFTLKALKDTDALEGDRIYAITTNPSGELLSDFSDFMKLGKTAFCLIPTKADDLLSDDFGDVLVSIDSTDQIAEMVGVAL